MVIRTLPQTKAKTRTKVAAGGGDSRAGQKTTMMFVFLAGFCMINARWYSPFTDFVIDTDTRETIALEPTTSFSGSISQPLCSQVLGLYDGNLSLVEDAVVQANDFHGNGGSLKAVQEYLDRQIPATLDRLDISYDPSEKQGNNNVPVGEYLRQYYATHDVPRGGYGQPLPLTLQGHNVAKVLNRDRVQHRWMDVMETWTRERFQVAVGPALPQCPHMAKLAEGTYEGKNFCIPDPAADGQSQDGDDSDCHIFSIGSNDQWGFEEELLQKLPNCHVHTFDCTLNNNTPLHKPNSTKIHFYPHCVSGKATNDNVVEAANEPVTAGGKSYRSYYGLVQATGIQHPPKVLKMDVEGFEFDVLSGMLKASPPSLWPQQIMMEVHFASRMVDLEWLLRTRQTAEMAMFFDLLYNKGGYMPAHVKYINGCATCMEILLVRIHCAEERTGGTGVVM